MPTETTPPNGGEDDALRQEVTAFIGVLTQGNPIAVQQAVIDIRTRYNESVLALVLDEAGRQIAAAQRIWGIAAMSWYQSFQTVGYAPQTLPQVVARIQQSGS